MSSRRVRTLLLPLALLGCPALLSGVEPPKGAQGPFSGTSPAPYVWNGDLRELPQADVEERVIKVPGVFRLTPVEKKALAAKGLRPEAARKAAPTASSAPMPAATTFAGMSFSSYGSGWPPDTNGDVGPTHFIQTVNSSIGIYNKATGALISAVTLNTFFQGPVGTPCDTANRGDPVVVYDAAVDRWMVTDFAWTTAAASTGPYYECIAYSQSGDPVSGGWTYYAFQTDTGTFAGYLSDYPKIGVWPDGYYMSANMFEAAGNAPGFGVRLWAFDKTPFLTGAAIKEVHYDLCTDGTCAGFLPGNLRGTAPPAGSPNVFAHASTGTSIDLYKLHADFVTPASSTLTGPVQVPVSTYPMFTGEIPQTGTTRTLDAISFRLMMQLQYRNYGSRQALYAAHTIDSGGVASTRWYELADPLGTPALRQEGTHTAADGLHRWMGSIAADRDGNLALGYSASGSAAWPSIRYAGQRAGETPGTLPQTEATLIAGTGSQTTYNRWGDYSAMTVDPSDGCTFWYTTEYYTTTGTNWQTRIGSFKFPSCAQTLGTLSGTIRDSATNAGIAGAPVTVTGTETLSGTADASGSYSLQVLAGTYSVTGGPVVPGYPASATVGGQSVAAGSTTAVDVFLTPAAHLVYGSQQVLDPRPGGNANGAAEPGESFQLFVTLSNDGAAAATGISAVLSTSTPGVTVTQSASAYPDIPAGGTGKSTAAYLVTLAPSVTCGTVVSFQLAVTSAQGAFSPSFTLLVGTAQPLVNAFFDDFEAGTNGWTTGGTSNTWAQTTSQASSPTHSFTDSPSGSYVNNTNSWLQTPAVDLSGKTGVTVSAKVRYDLEAQYDFVYLEYSLNGGSSWNATPLATWTGAQAAWTTSSVAAPALDNQASVRLRYRLVSDGGVVADGFYVDDFAVKYQPIVCQALPVELLGFDVE